MYRHAATKSARTATLLSLIAALPAVASAQVVGDNVNMVSGTGWPGGDPFLQRQNEPSIAVSSANPSHLLAGANDYRSVDLPKVTSGDTKFAADAWQGVFKSYDGGMTWKSYLMPGYALDPTSPDRTGSETTPPYAGNSAMRTACGAKSPCNAAADSVVRAGTDGMLYFSGITFARGSDYGAVVLNRFIDLNNKENGDPLTASDPIQWVDAKVLDASNGAYFADKPWIAVDVPRSISSKFGNISPVQCTITSPKNGANGKPLFQRSFLGGAIYAVWSRIYAPTATQPNETADIMFSVSRDCGATWSTARKLNDSTSLASQGAVLSVDPRTGDVYVAWRRFAVAATATTPAQSDAIFVVRSFSGGQRFTYPRLLTSFVPYEQDPSPGAFRTEAFPAMATAVSQDGTQSWTYVAWAQRKGNSPTGDGRIMLTVVPVKPPPSSDDEHDDDCGGWTLPATAIDDGPIYDDTGTGHPISRGHQFMPQLTFSQGRLVAVYYDSRLDHVGRYYTPNMVNGVWTMTSDGRWYTLEHGPIGERAWATDQLNWNTPGIDDTGTYNRHTIDVRVAVAVPQPPPAVPVFQSLLASRMPFGERGDEALPNALDLARDGRDYDASGNLLARPFGFLGTHIDLVSPGVPFPLSSTQQPVSLLRLRDLQANVPNVPMFKNGTTPFIGDYIDVQGPAFVRTATGWAHNTQWSPAPVFHAVWTSNQDVVPPADGDWTHYTPVSAFSGKTSIIDASQAVPACIPGQAGARNQNVYTARVTDGLVVSSPQNAKVLDPSGATARSFVVSAFNSTAIARNFRFAFGSVNTGVSFGFGTSRAPYVDVKIPARSSSSQTVFLQLQGTGTNPATAVVTVTETGVSGTPLSGAVTLNPPGLTFSLLAADGWTNSADGGEVFAVKVGAPTVYNSSLASSSLVNSTIVNSSLASSSLASSSLASSSLASSSLASVAFCSSSLASSSLCSSSLASWSLASSSLASSSLASSSLASSSLASSSLCSSSLASASFCNSSLASSSLASSSLASSSLASSSLASSSLASANVATSSLASSSLASSSLASSSLASSSLASSSLASASMTDLNYTVTNVGNTAQAFDLSLLANSPSVAVQVIVSKTPTKPVAVGCTLVETADNQIVVNAGTIDPMNPPASSLASFAMAPGETIQVTLRSMTTLDGAVALGSAVTPLVKPQGSTAAPTPALTITTADPLPTATVGDTSLSVPLAAIGGTGTLTWGCPVGDCTRLPPGLSITTGGQLTGTPTTQGSFTFGVTVTDQSTPPNVTIKVLHLTVQARTTTTSLQPSSTGPAYGQPVTLQATVSPSNTPGNVAFAEKLADGSLQALGSAALVGGIGSWPSASGGTTLLPSVGTHAYRATYAGDTNWLGSTSSDVTVAVSQASTSIGLTLTPVGTAPGASSGSSSYGDTASFTATVSWSGSGAAPTGSVDFYDGTSKIATRPLSGATSVLTLATLGPATHAITARYTGDGNYLDSGASSPVTQVVSMATPSISLAVTNPASGPSTYGKPVTFTATVTWPGSGAVPTGSVSFYEGTTLLGTGTLVSTGSAFVQLTTLSAGSHQVTATYAGDANYNGAGPGSPVSLTVNKATTVLTVAGALQGGATFTGTTYPVYGSITASVGPVSSGVPGPTGSISFVDGGVFLSSATVGNLTTSATYTSGTLGAGTHQLGATYSGDDNYSAVTTPKYSTTGLFTVSPVAVTASLSGPTWDRVSALPYYGDALRFDGFTTDPATGNVIRVTDTGGKVDFFQTGTLPLASVLLGAVAPYDPTQATIFAPDTARAPFGIAPIPAGTGRRVSACFHGTANFAGQDPTCGTSSATTVGCPPCAEVSFEVAAAPVTVAFLSPPTSITIGSSLSLSCGVAADPTVAAAAGYPTGSVVVSDQAGTSPRTTLGTFTLGGAGGCTTAAGSCACSASSCTVTTAAFTAGPAGSHSFVCDYQGDAQSPNFQIGAATYVQAVARAATTTTLTASTPSCNAGQAVTLTARVTSGLAGTPTGLVIFKDTFNGVTSNLGQANLASGSATLSVSNLAVGSHSIVASYQGDATYQNSDSTPPTTVAVKVAYKWTGFQTPLKTAGDEATPTASGSSNYGSATPIKYQVQDSSTLAYVSDPSSTKRIEAWTNSSTNCTGAPPKGSTMFLLYDSPTNFTSGGSTFRYSTNTWIFNWDTTKGGIQKGCYNIVVRLADGQVKATTLLLK